MALICLLLIKYVGIGVARSDVVILTHLGCCCCCCYCCCCYCCCCYCYCCCCRITKHPSTSRALLVTNPLYSRYCALHAATAPRFHGSHSSPNAVHTTKSACSSCYYYKPLCRATSFATRKAARFCTSAQCTVPATLLHWLSSTKSRPTSKIYSAAPLCTRHVLRKPAVRSTSSVC
jgi:hypothetical protein